LVQFPNKFKTALFDTPKGRIFWSCLYFSHKQRCYSGIMDANSSVHNCLFIIDKQRFQCNFEIIQHIYN
jgi:hypothetical protein